MTTFGLISDSGDSKSCEISSAKTPQIASMGFSFKISSGMFGPTLEWMESVGVHRIFGQSSLFSILFAYQQRSGSN